MTNGNDSGDQPGGDWESPPEQPDGNGGGADHQPPAATVGGRSYEGVHPFADNAFDIGAFVEAAKLTFERAMDSNVLKAFIALTLIPFAWDLFTGGTMMVAGFVSGTVAGILGAMLTVFGLLFIPIFWAVSATQVALQRPLAHRVFDRTVDYGSILDTIKAVLNKIVAVFFTTVLVTLGSIIGICACGVGLLIVAFFLAQAPYLVAVHDRGVIDSLQESFERGKAHWHLVLMFFIPVIGISVITWGAVGVGQMIAGFIPHVGYLIGPVFQWVGAVIVGVTTFILGTTAFSNIDELEGIATIDR